jgi:light-independent protochlorophyllide reductase subunit B
VTYTTFQARDLGKDTAELFQDAARDAYERFQPEAMIVGASCTAELIQDDPGGLAEALASAGTGGPARAARVPAQGKLGRSRDLLSLVRTLAAQASDDRPQKLRPSCNLLGPTALGFRHRDDVTE